MRAARESVLTRMLTGGATLETLIMHLRAILIQAISATATATATTTDTGIHFIHQNNKIIRYEGK